MDEGTQQSTLGKGQRSRALLLGILLVLVLLTLRGPGLVWEVLNIDESDFYLYGKSIVEGGDSYISFVEKKPPLVYGFYAALIWLGMDDLRLIRLFTAFWVLMGCFVVHRTALVAGLGSKAAWTSAFVFGAFSSNITVATDCETLMNLPVAVMALLGLSSRKTSNVFLRVLFLVLAGASAGIAVGFKHQAGMALVALVGYLLTTGNKGRFLQVLAAVSGFGAVIVMMSLWFWLSGRWDAFVEWNLVRNVIYTREATSFDIFRILRSLGAYGFLNNAAFLAMGVWAIREARREGDPLRRDLLFLATWLYWTAWIAVLPGLRFYRHYFLQLVPGAALLGALFFSRPHPVHVTRSVILIMVAAIVGFGADLWAYGFIGKKYPSQDPIANKIAAWLRENTRPEDCVYVWGYFNPVYYLADRRPGSRFINPSPIIGDFDPGHIKGKFDPRPYVRLDDAQVLINDLESNRCRVFVDTSPSNLHSWQRFSLEVVPNLEQYVNRFYSPQAVVAGATILVRNAEVATQSKAMAPQRLSKGEGG